MKKLQTGDKVIVVAGKWKWTISTILWIGMKKDERRGLRVTVKWVNTVKKAKKWEGFQEFEAAIHSSNVMLYDEKSKSGSRVGVRDGKKWRERFYKKSGDLVKK